MRRTLKSFGSLRAEFRRSKAPNAARYRIIAPQLAIDKYARHDQRLAGGRGARDALGARGHLGDARRARRDAPPPIVELGQ